MRTTRPALLALGFAAAFSVSTTAMNDRFWPQWRGPHASGVSASAKPPLTWSETSNIRWKKEIPGRGAGTPVIWDNQVFLSTAIPVGVTEAEAHAARGTNPAPTSTSSCRSTGRTAASCGSGSRARRRRTKRAHQEWGTWASPSVVTDGTHVIASFESRGIYAYDMKGTPVWTEGPRRQDDAQPFGEGSSPALHGNTLVIVWDHQGESFIVALDKRTGEERWREVRDEIDTWATPLVVEVNGRAQVVTSGTKQVRSYDLETGQVVWHSAGHDDERDPVAGGGRRPA